MMKSITLALAMAATAFTAGAAVEEAEFYGFANVLAGSYNGMDYVGMTQVKVTNDEADFDMPWTFASETLFGCNIGATSCARPINSGWIYDNSVYAARYVAKSWAQTINEILVFDTNGSVKKTISLDDYDCLLLKAILNSQDGYLYAWTTDYSSLNFGRIRPADVEDFANKFEVIKTTGFSYMKYPAGVFEKDGVIYYTTLELELNRVDASNGNTTMLGKLTGISEFAGELWTSFDRDNAGFAMIYSESIGKVIMSTPRESDTMSCNPYAHAFEVPNEPKSKIPADFIKTFAHEYWTTFFPMGAVVEAEYGTPAAPKEVMITKVEDKDDEYMVSWNAVTTSAEEGKVVDLKNLTYTVSLNGIEIANGEPGTNVTLSIPATSEPVDYTAEVVAVTPQGSSEAGVSNTITVSKQNGVQGVADKFEVKASNGMLTVAANGGITVYSISGAVVANGENTLSAQLPASVYIVVANGKTVKVTL